ncbi:polyadenylate-binding protein-interacting protein 11-like [Silene latifolia]|uniref:polyadenylate-binding protein-interacting protein 11-like n=1 Tax=Silene latifolia TaxID=37657 RepID=UPI003D781568
MALVKRNGVDAREMREVENMMSKLNPLAREFVPPSHHWSGVTQHPRFHQHQQQRPVPRHRKSRSNRSRTGQAQRDEVIRRTVFVSEIHHQVTEEQLASLFINCGSVVDCRICGDPNSVLRFAFIEFTDEDGARAALSISGTILDFHPVKVLPSKTAIAPVNPTFLPQSENEREMCARTIYCTNIDKKVSQADLKLFFESVCGQVYRSKMLGDNRHPTRIAFVEFVMAESATAALNCSGVVLGSSAIRVSPSKTPIRPR